MSNQIQPFDFNGIQVRVLTDEHGNPWFLGSYVCTILSTATNHIREYLDADEITNIRTTDIAQNGGKAPVSCPSPIPATQPHPLVRTGRTTPTRQGTTMKITTPNGILEGENIEAILKEHGFDCLHGADLSHADLRGADLIGMCLRKANLSDANLCYSNLRGADLSNANLCHSCLRGANLRNANLRDADGADLITARASIIPDEGDIIGWKKHG